MFFTGEGGCLLVRHSRVSIFAHPSVGREEKFSLPPRTTWKRHSTTVARAAYSMYVHPLQILHALQLSSSSCNSTTCMYHRKEDHGYRELKESPFSWDSRVLLIVGHARITMTHGVDAAAVFLYVSAVSPPKETLRTPFKSSANSRPTRAPGCRCSKQPFLTSAAQNVRCVDGQLCRYR